MSGLDSAPLQNGGNPDDIEKLAGEVASFSVAGADSNDGLVKPEPASHDDVDSNVQRFASPFGPNAAQEPPIPTAEHVRKDIKQHPWRPSPSGGDEGDEDASKLEVIPQPVVTVSPTLLHVPAPSQSDGDQDNTQHDHRSRSAASLPPCPDGGETTSNCAEHDHSSQPLPPAPSQPIPNKDEDISDRTKHEITASQPAVNNTSSALLVPTPGSLPSRGLTGNSSQVCYNIDQHKTNPEIKEIEIEKVKKQLRQEQENAEQLQHDLQQVQEENEAKDHEITKLKDLLELSKEKIKELEDKVSDLKNQIPEKQQIQGTVFYTHRPVNKLHSCRGQEISYNSGVQWNLRIKDQSFVIC